MNVQGIEETRVYSTRSGQELWNKVVDEFARLMGPVERKAFLLQNQNVHAKNFPSGDVYVQLPINTRKKSVHVISAFQRPDWFEVKKAVTESNIPLEMKIELIQNYVHTTDTDLMELYKINDACIRAGARDISVYFSNFPDARQDKKDEPRVPISSSLILGLTEESARTAHLRFGAVDLHAEQIQGMTKHPFDEIPFQYLLLGYIKDRLGSLDNVVLLLPDAGSGKRYEGLMQDTGIARTILQKRRSAHGKSEITGFEGVSPKGKICIILDDIIDSGGTTCNAGVWAYNHGAEEVYSLSTHLLASTKVKKDDNGIITGFSYAEDVMKNSNIKFISSDTVPRTDNYRREHPFLTQYTIAPCLANLIHCNEYGISFGDAITDIKKVVLNGTKQELTSLLERHFVYK